jgi:hypothetical protein
MSELSIKKQLMLFIHLSLICHLCISQNNKHIDLARTKQKAMEAKSFCKLTSLNMDYCILIDMSLHSGVKRFMVWDFANDTILSCGLVSHGCCNNAWSGDNSKSEVQFSFVNGSHCTSPGKYKIGKRAYSQWGINVKYTMQGLDKENKNAEERQIVFHSWNAVSEAQVYPSGTPEGWGCPAIADAYMKTIDALLQKEKTPVLMWIYK